MKLSNGAMAYAPALVLLLGGVSGPAVSRLAAQCPDGSPPPCRSQPAASRAPAANSVAVLSFESPDTADDYLASGLTEDIATLLGGVSSVQVKSPGVVRRAQRTAGANLTSVARALGVRYLVDGTVRHVGARMRVSARLVRGSTAVAVWGQIFDGSAEELLALPARITRAVATRVGGTITREESAALGVQRTRSPAAYDHFLRGNFLLATRSSSGIQQALDEYLEAERLDSGFTAALGRAAYGYAVACATSTSIPGVSDDARVARGLAMADRAIASDSTASDAWMARGYLYAFANPRTLAGARESFERAIALEPQNAEAHHQYAQILNLLGDDDGAERELRTALALEPGRVISLVDLAGWVRPRDTQLDRRLLDSAIALEPAFWIAYLRRAETRLLLHDVAGAVADAEMAVRLGPSSVECILAAASVQAGDTARARSIVRRLTAVPISDKSPEWCTARAILALGDTAAVLDRLDHVPRTALLWVGLRRPEFDALRGNPRFERVIAESRPPGAAGPH